MEKLSLPRFLPPRSRIEKGPTAVRISSKQLLGTDRQLTIEHGGRDYRLRLTKNGKLILTA